jgi:N,N-dimethylformamidase beta subunit-like, C-terminal
MKKFTILSICCIVFLSTFLYMTINNNIFYHFQEFGNIPHLITTYYSYLNDILPVSKVSFSDNLSVSASHDIRKLISVGGINGDNKTSKPFEEIYPNNKNITHKDIQKYFFSENRSEIHSPENNSHTLEFENKSIAVVKPTFTDAAYNNSFYNFYRLYASVPINTNITTNLNLLYSKLSNNQEGAISNVFAMLNMIKNLKWITNNSNITVISDQDVDSNSIFNKDGSNKYNILILGHQEYVTQQEYDNLKEFVSNGGTMILLDGNALYVQVKYDSSTNQISLVKGHGWAFNGKSAWKSVDERWKNETSQWVGSNYLCNVCHISYLHNPFQYIHHEENYITNPNDIILLKYRFTDPVDNLSKNLVVATYELNYKKGKVIALGLYSDDIINNGNFDRFFDSLLIKDVFKNNLK